MAKLIGDYPQIERVVTGLWSLDMALAGELKDETGKVIITPGVPMTGYEIFGFQDVGKSTWATSISGMIAGKLKKDIIYLPMEHVDRDLIGSILYDFDGTCYILGGWDMAKKFVDAKKSAETPIPTDEINIDCYLAALRYDDICAGIVDSLSSIETVSGAESSSAENNIGGARRAKLSSFLAKGINYSRRYRTSPFISFLITHKTGQIGMFPTNSGSNTTGGEVKKNLSKVRIQLKRMPEKSINALGHWVIEGFVEKLSFGKEKNKFYNVVLGGQGVHIGMSALYDCKRLKLATFGKSITMNGEKYGSMEFVVSKALAGEDEFFHPFIEALKDPSKITKVVAEKEDENEVWEGDE